MNLHVAMCCRLLSMTVNCCKVVGFGRSWSLWCTCLCYKRLDSAIRSRTASGPGLLLKFIIVCL